jgi:hypothetical protein
LGVLVSGISYYGIEYFLIKQPQKECTNVKDCKIQDYDNLNDNNQDFNKNKKDIINDNINNTNLNNKKSIFKIVIFIFILLLLVYLIYYFLSKRYI